MQPTFTDQPLKVAFLGPRGTYSHQAAQNHFGCDVEFIEKATIADVLNAVPLEVPIAVIPAENSIYGPVIETLDLLRLPEVGNEKLITGEITLRVQHCLLAIGGTKLSDIKNVFSHEQAIGQCSDFLATNLPNAVLRKTSSTAAAAEAILSDDLRQNSAAICSESCTVACPDLTVLKKPIQNEDNNFTRFWIVKESKVALSSSPVPTGECHALLRMSPSCKQSLNLSSAITELKLALRSLDRRPSSRGIPFHDVYFLHVLQDPAHRRLLGQTCSWVEEVGSALERVRALGWEVAVLGIWCA